MREPGQVFTPGAAAGAEHSLIELGGAKQSVLMFTPRGRGAFREQADEALSVVDKTLKEQPQPMSIVTQTIFLSDWDCQAECEQVLAARYGRRLPVRNYVVQPPCSGAALAIEVWAVGGDGVLVERLGDKALVVSYGGLRWVHCAGITPAPAEKSAYTQTLDTLNQMRATLERAGTGFESVVRTWFYLGDITGPEIKNKDTLRYEELNRARTDFFCGIRFYPSVLRSGDHGKAYPSSTGIGMGGGGLVTSCLSFETMRDDMFLLPLENPLQKPACDYGCSLQSPKFSRAMALLSGDALMVWISGTASIIDEESRYLNDIEKQTERVIDNIGKLISRENFALHGVDGAGASLRDLASVRVYVKHIEDFDKCRAVCERRLAGVPAIYTVADVCRPELLVEIEGVAFSKRLPA